MTPPSDYAKDIEKQHLKYWLVNIAKNLSKEQKVDFLKDYTFSFINTCLEELTKEGYSIELFESE